MRWLETLKSSRWGEKAWTHSPRTYRCYLRTCRRQYQNQVLHSTFTANQPHPDQRDMPCTARRTRTDATHGSVRIKVPISPSDARRRLFRDGLKDCVRGVPIM